MIFSVRRRDRARNWRARRLARLVPTEIGLAPLYDVVSTLYYPEPSRDMAMKIGAEYSSEKVTARNCEQLAEEAGPGKPLVRGRVPELAERVIGTLARVEIAHPVAEKVAGPYFRFQ